jgi:gliding motility-associated lipoprotein GldD
MKYTSSTSLFLISFSLFLILLSCNSSYTSKPRGYFKIDLPKREYVKFERDSFPFSFEYPAYAKIVRDTSYFDSSPDYPFWFNIDFPSLNGKIYISYKTIGGSSVYKIKKNGVYVDSLGGNVFDKLIADAYKITFKNDVKAYSIEDSVMHTPNGVTGIFFRVSGNVATAKQFFLTDTTKNFLRGALYFDATPNEDSLRPVNDFLQADLNHIINTFKWKK